MQQKCPSPQKSVKRKVMTFHQANGDLNNLFRLFSALLHKNEYIPGVLLFKIISSIKIDPA
jgi:hypothetical protein